MSDNPAGAGTDDAKERLAKIYSLGLLARTMLLTAQGKPLDPDHPHTASHPTPEQAAEKMLLAEMAVGALLEKLDEFARSFGLSALWWFPATGVEKKAGE